MRKNKKDRKNLSVGTDNSANKIAPKTKKTPLISKALDKVRGVRVVYSIKGLNLDAFINLLKNRNIVLKEQKFDLLEMYDIPLVKEGLEIQKRRKKAILPRQ